MHIEHLIKMANDISNFFNAEPDKKVAIEGMTRHLKRTWAPKMRQELIEYAQTDGKELSQLAQDVIAHLHVDLK